MFCSNKRRLYCCEENLDICDTGAHLGDISVTTSKENALLLGQFPRSFVEIDPEISSKSHFSRECNFDVQGSEESFVFELMHSHSEAERMHICKQHFEAVSVQIV